MSTSENTRTSADASMGSVTSSGRIGRRPLLRGLVGTVLAGGATAFGEAAPASAAAPAIPSGIAIPGTHLTYEISQADLDREMQLIVDSGSKWLRFDIPLCQIEYKQGSRYWGNVDRVVASANAKGLSITATLSTLPGWTASSWKVGATNDTQRNAFAACAKEAAARYAGKISYWGIWNEPNNPAFWSNPSVSQYVSLLKPAYTAIKQGNPNSSVLLGGPAGGMYAPNDTVSWYRNLYALGAKNYFNAADMHAYPNGGGGPTSGEQANVTKVLAIMDANGDQGKKIWGTESGFPTGGSNSISEAGQATLLTGLFANWTKVGGSRVGPLFVYTLRDLPGAYDREKYFGILRNDWSKKPAFNALKARNAGTTS